MLPRRIKQDKSVRQQVVGGPRVSRNQDSGFGNQKLEIRNQLPIRFVLHRNLIFTIFSSQKSDFHSELSILYSRLVVTTHEHSKLSILNTLDSQFRFTIT